MAKYLVEIEETLVKTLLVEAEDGEQAVDLVQAAYDNSEIILDSDDFTGEVITWTQEIVEDDPDIDIYEKFN